MLSRTGENYLRTIYEIIEKKGYVRVKDIADSLEVKPSTASEMLEKLAVVNLIIYEKRRGITLTNDGRKVAELINARYKIFLRLFELAGVSPKTAYRDACILEHYVSDETNNAVQALVEKLELNKI
ncbi:metal-dependent transcriptional regulator [Candidatus Micrarchaeota archaeon]|nr:metal-dependent transcriptional regulator [Candidatus Micrarchaeota archaeon]